MSNIILCPGHHARRTGAKNAAMGLNEYDEACKVVARVSDILEQAGHSARIVKGALVNKISQINASHDMQRVDLAIDLHFNADADHLDPNDFDNERGNGCMVMAIPRSDKRMEQANLISEYMARYLGEEDRGGREGWYHGGSAPGTQPDAFLMQTKCPAFIPEPGYIDNSGFADRCLIGDQWERVAAALSTALMTYLARYADD